jgi:hypothetical protein
MQLENLSPNLLRISLICAFDIFSRFRTAFDAVDVRKREKIRNAHIGEMRSKLWPNLRLRG